MTACHMEKIRHRFGDRTVLSLDDFRIEEREFLVLVGPSGSGKTTLLRLLAGLLDIQEGVIRIGDRNASSLAPHEREIGVVFQGLGLWPHMSVRGNIALGLKKLVPDAAQRTQRIEETARELGIYEHLGQRPGRLSGGERQRVAIARALVRRPRLLLLDEPFSDLDARLRRRAARLVRDLHDRHNMTTLLITHDRTDAHLLADRIGVLRDGELVGCAKPESLYREPGNRFVAEFLTDAAILAGRVTESGAVETVLGSIPLIDGLAEGAAAGQTVHVAVRPEELRLGDEGADGTVLACEFAGESWRCRVAVDDQEVAVLHHESMPAGASVRVAAPMSARRPLQPLDKSGELA
ncbi:MAG: ABC transporter ATP-binding protein [Planctomycetota bacterium]